MSGLTPIRVRGRRKRVKPSHDDQNQNPDAKPVRSNQRGKALLPLDAFRRSLQSRRKRPFISGSAWLNTQPRSQSQSQSQLGSLSQLQYQYQSDSQPKKKKRKNLSRLERLPVELLEKIFLHALNVNFARSSLSLAAAVSSERIYRVLIILAFWRDPCRSPTSSEGEDGDRRSVGVARILRPLDYVPIGEDERQILQSTVFRCKWCTVRRVLNYLPDLMALNIQRLWIDVGITMDNDQKHSLNRYLESPTEKGSGGAIRTFQGTRNNKHYTLTLTPLVSIQITSPDTNHDKTIYPLLNLREFPSHLLHGGTHGFNRTDIAFLELLRSSSGFNRTGHSSMRAARNISLNRDALQEGVHKAIISQNHDALTTLLKIDEYYFRATSSSGEVYTLPAEHYRTSLPSTTIFKLLLRASAESVPPDDSYITAWAMELCDAFGGWLLDLMLRMPEMREVVRGRPDVGVFWMGRCNAGNEMGGRYLRDVLGVEGELEGWMGEGVDFVSLAGE